MPQCNYKDTPFRCVLEEGHNDVVEPHASYTADNVDIRLPRYRWNDFNKRQVRDNSQKFEMPVELKTLVDAIRSISKT